MTKNILLNYPTTIIGDLNIDVMIKTSQSNALQNFKPTFKESTTIYDIQIDHIWTNACTQQCDSTITEAYWTNKKLIHFAFKLPNYVPQFTLQ
jgi:hypothetical protein